MKILIIKMSSLGDVVHALPLATDIHARYQDAVIDWVAEEAFADIPSLHGHVSSVIPVALRRWRRNWWSAQTRREFSQFVQRLRRDRYDLVIDAQGLLKSALVTRLARGSSGGLDYRSSRESVSSFFYHRRVEVDKQKHAIDRVRELGGSLLNYKPETEVEFGLSRAPQGQRNSIMLLHGTTWPSKHWPEEQWKALADLVEDDGYQVIVPWGSDVEHSRALRIASEASVLPRMTVRELTDKIASCAGVVTVDTGLGHLASALEVPTVALYGSTDPELTAIRGAYQTTIVSDHLPCIPCRKRNCKFSSDDCKIYPPCFKTTPEATWKALLSQIKTASQI
ncbi:MAG TPA: lipopolysaccharide heptosyltransferase I [Gammaproteobacteria bacterium]|nr:lipopolysaccharide heptosyltransferase I [Gammaproteobacteria bacterium]|tara:strand:+ start:1348 stop:2361 length:1014 start_codon:yes stop_codon:yes gene_type:complete